MYYKSISNALHHCSYLCIYNYYLRTYHIKMLNYYIDLFILETQKANIQK